MARTFEDPISTVLRQCAKGNGNREASTGFSVGDARRFDARYAKDPAGDEHMRFRYSPRAEGQRRSDAVRLSSTATVLTDGTQYRQLAHELHASWQ